MWILVVIPVVVIGLWLTLALGSYYAVGQSLRRAQGMFDESMALMRLKGVVKEWSDVTSCLPEGPSTIVQSHIVGDHGHPLFMKAGLEFTCWFPQNVCRRFTQEVGMDPQDETGEYRGEFFDWMFNVLEFNRGIPFWVTELPDDLQRLNSKALAAELEKRYSASQLEVIDLGL